MRIYTKTGDTGQTGLLGGGRISKTSLTMEAIGGVDEVNSLIGWARVVCNHPGVQGTLEWVQQRLFCLGAELASPAEKRGLNPIAASDSARLEQAMDALDPYLEPLKNFILPGGCESASRLHMARTVCRRAERVVWEWTLTEGRRDELPVFLNRLSDWLFTAARAENAHANVAEVVWKEIETKP